MFEEKDQDQGQEQERPEKLPPERPQVAVDLSEPDDEGDEQQAAPETKKARREQTRDFRRQREEFKRQLGDYERRLNELQSQIARGQPQTPAQQQQPADPYDPQIAALTTQYDALVLAIQAPGQSQEQVMKLVDQARKLEDQRNRLRMRQEWQAMRSEGGEEGGQGGDSYIKQAMAAEFPQVFANEALRTRALAEAADLVHNKKRPWSLETARESAQRALAAFGMGGKIPQPTPVDRARLSGVPSRAGANGGGTGGVYNPPPFEMSMAKAWVKGRPGADTMTDEEVWRTWSRETNNRRQAG